MGAAAEPACYIYGVVPEDVELAPDARGVGDPPGRIRLVRHGDIAALTSEIGSSQPLRRPADLRAHRELLDAAAAEVPVLPVPFGTVVANQAAVVDELLGPGHDEFAAAVKELDGRAEYLVRSRYRGQAAEGAEPRDELSDTIADALTRYCAAIRVRGNSAEGADVAVLMDTARQADLERDAAELARRFHGRVDVRVTGPIAAYDFVTALTGG